MIRLVRREQLNIMENGERGMGNGEWGMGNGEWGTGNGEWRMENLELRTPSRARIALPHIVNSQFPIPYSPFCGGRRREDCPGLSARAWISLERH
jgi:hypothetical protein